MGKKGDQQPEGGNNNVADLKFLREQDDGDTKEKLIQAQNAWICMMHGGL